MHLIRTFLLSLSALLTACTTPPHPSASGCNGEAIDRASTAAALREISRECLSTQKTEHFALAISKLNDLPAVAGRKLQLQAAVPRADSEQVSFELDVYFNFLEANLAESGTDKLDELIQRLNSTYMIHSVYVVGRSEQSEKELTSFKVAQKRANFVRRYLLAAGVQNNVPFELHEAGPRQPDTQEGRARDRSASILVMAYRRSSAEGKRAL